MKKSYQGGVDKETDLGNKDGGIRSLTTFVSVLRPAIQ